MAVRGESQHTPARNGQCTKAESTTFRLLEDVDEVEVKTNQGPTVTDYETVWKTVRTIQPTNRRWTKGSVIV